MMMMMMIMTPPSAAFKLFEQANLKYTHEKLNSSFDTLITSVRSVPPKPPI
jgi:hypothetical protein